MEHSHTPHSQPHPEQPPAPVASPPAHPQPQSGGNGFAIAALVLGIIAFLFGWTGVFNILTAILAVVFGIISLTKHQSKGMGLTGLILGSIGLLASICFMILQIVAFTNGFNEARKESLSSPNSSITKPQKSNWDVDAAYVKIKTGMTKSEVEDATGKKSEGCSVTDDNYFGDLETCSYGNSLTDHGSISVTYINGKVSNKSKYSE